MKRFRFSTKQSSNFTYILEIIFLILINNNSALAMEQQKIKPEWKDYIYSKDDVKYKDEYSIPYNLIKSIVLKIVECYHRLFHYKDQQFEAIYHIQKNHYSQPINNNNEKRVTLHQDALLAKAQIIYLKKILKMGINSKNIDAIDLTTNDALNEIIAQIDTQDPIWKFFANDHNLMRVLQQASIYGDNNVNVYRGYESN
jgi:hypothetical protein